MTVQTLQTREHADLQVVGLSVEQYHQMIEQGILPEGAPIELIDGLLVRKDRSHVGEDPMTVGQQHVWAIYLLGELNQKLKPHQCHIHTQQPVTLGSANEPEPDGIILRGLPAQYKGRKAQAADVLIAIEVADSSLQIDRTTKQRIYAQGQIPTYIIVNLIDRKIELYTQPNASLGRYASSTDFKPGQSVPFPLATGTNIDVAVDELLP